MPETFQVSGSNLLAICQNKQDLFFASFSLLNGIGWVITKRFKMPEDSENLNAKRYKTELIVIIALMIIVAVFIVMQVIPQL